jgi:pSer/pThr/pTyr-binding forkhead associated (FHA) protein
LTIRPDDDVPADAHGSPREPRPAAQTWVPPAPAPVPREGSAPALVYRDGPLAGRRIEVLGEVVIGREQVDVLIDDPEVSRRHASVRAMNGRLQIADLGSSNGTYVNGVKVRQARMLEDGDEVRIGRVLLRVVLPRQARSTVVSGDESTRDSP